MKLIITLYIVALTTACTSIPSSKQPVEEFVIITTRIPLPTPFILTEIVIPPPPPVTAYVREPIINKCVNRFHLIEECNGINGYISSE